jgi:hypothetical protein
MWTNMKYDDKLLSSSEILQKTDVKIVVGGHCVRRDMGAAVPSVGVELEKQTLPMSVKSSSSGPSATAAAVVATTAVTCADVRIAAVKTGQQLPSSIEQLAAYDSDVVTHQSLTERVQDQQLMTGPAGQLAEPQQQQQQQQPQGLKDGVVYELPVGVRSLCSLEQWCKYSGVLMIKVCT